MIVVYAIIRRFEVDVAREKVEHAKKEARSIPACG
jgi:hypothetical protein